MTRSLVPYLLLLGPLAVLVVIELLRRSPTMSHSYYARFLVIGFTHGLVLLALFLRSEWRPHHDWTTVRDAAPFGILLGLAFAAVYLVVAYLFARLRRQSHPD